VLGLDCGQIIAGRDDATVEDNEVIFAWGKDYRLLGACAERKAGEEDGGVVGDFGQEARVHFW
jgi:hypothetical protein